MMEAAVRFVRLPASEALTDAWADLYTGGGRDRRSPQRNRASP